MNNKTFLFVLIIFISSTLLAQKEPPSSDEIMNEAFATAKKENKKVFVIFHASWCGWCHKMDTAMNDISVKKYFDDNFVVRHLVIFESEKNLNLENKGSREMYARYNDENQGIPFWLIFDKDEKLLGDARMKVVSNDKVTLQNCGCPATKDEVEHFINVLQKTTSLKSEQLEKIRTRFRKNEI